MSRELKSVNPPKVKLTRKQREKLKMALSWAEKFFRDAESSRRVVMGGHGFDHNKRVCGMASVLAALENKDPFLPTLCAIIFDIGRTSKDERAHSWKHGELSREMAEDFLENLGLSNEELTLVKNAVADHPKLNENIPKERRTYVTKILMDADRLDSIGALGPVRGAATRWRLPLFTGEERRSGKEGEIKSIYQDFAMRVTQWYKSLWTKSAREIARPRQRFLLGFCKEYKKEAGFMQQAFKNLKID